METGVTQVNLHQIVLTYCCFVVYFKINVLQNEDFYSTTFVVYWLLCDHLTKVHSQHNIASNFSACQEMHVNAGYTLFSWRAARFCGCAPVCINNWYPRIPYVSCSFVSLFSGCK